MFYERRPAVRGYDLLSGRAEITPTAKWRHFRVELKFSANETASGLGHFETFIRGWFTSQMTCTLSIWRISGFFRSLPTTMRTLFVTVAIFRKRIPNIHSRLLNPEWCNSIIFSLLAVSGSRCQRHGSCGGKRYDIRDSVRDKISTDIKQGGFWQRGELPPFLYDNFEGFLVAA